MRRTRILLSLAMVMVCVQGWEARAATLPAMGLKEMVQKADLIVVGVPITRASAWNPEHTRIYTTTTFRVDESLKGQAGETVVIETLGGVVGGVGLMVPGMPEFKPQEKNLVFLIQGRHAGTHRVLGWAQGRFRIENDLATGREMISRNLNGLSLMGANAQAPESLRYLDEVRDAIRKLEGR
jgi:hypothetical protein